MGPTHVLKVTLWLNWSPNADADRTITIAAPIIPTHSGMQLFQRLALHNGSLFGAEGVAFSEGNSHLQEAVEDSVLFVNVLQEVLYIQVHENGVKINF